MKNLFKWVILFLVLALISLMIAGIIRKSKEGKLAKEKIETLPDFSFKTINDSIFSRNQIKDGPVLILFFNPECEHCQYQVQAVIKNREAISDVLVLMISNAGKEIVMDFIKSYNLIDFPRLVVLLDDTHSFDKFFGTETVPASFIYDKKLKLTKYFHGEATFETILGYLKKND
jgi:thiol-disulfide isomerase/thioredoxin